MNSTFSTALRAHLAGASQTKATGWKVTLRNGDVRGFTDLDRNITIDGVLYLSTAGYTRTDVSSSSALNVDNGEITGFLRAPAITEEDVRVGVWDYASVQMFVFNYRDLTMGRGIMRTGTVGRITLLRDTFTAEVRGLAQRFAYTIGRLYTPGCRHILGDAGCKIDLEASPQIWKVAGAIEDVSPDQITVYDSARAEPGPSDGVGITDIFGGTPGKIRVSPDVDWVNGTPIMISGVTTVPIINTTTIVRNIQHTAGYADIDLGIDLAGGLYAGSPGVAVELGQESGFFSFGTMEMVTGANAGVSMEIRDYVPGQWTLFLPFEYELAPGDEYILTAGCNKQLSTCRDKFDNVGNHGGFPHVPGIDRLMQIGKQ
jgi:hypothetical protein